MMLVLFIGLVSCSGLVYDDYEELVEEESPSPVVYLSIQRVQAAGTESYNADDDDFEDRIHDLALLVFDSSTGSKVGTYFDTNIPFSSKNTMFTVELTVGVRDFYFVANMPMGILGTIKNRSEMEDYLASNRDMNPFHFLNASEWNGFPMSGVYRNQVINHGGAVYSPQPFRPTNESGVVEDKIKLMRAVAKLEVILNDPADSASVRAVYYRNAFRTYSLTTNPAPAVHSFYPDQAIPKAHNAYVYYMPEAIMSSPSWSFSPDHKPINYFVIETIAGETFEIPVVTYDGAIASQEYLQYARGELSETPDYSIYRNRHYFFRVESLKKVEISYSIVPWNDVKKSTYMGYGYTVSVDESGLIDISNTIDACDPHSVRIEAIAPFQFEDGTSSKLFDLLPLESKASYKLDPIPTDGSGNYLEVYYNGILVKTFSR